MYITNALEIFLVLFVESVLIIYIYISAVYLRFWNEFSISQKKKIYIRKFHVVVMVNLFPAQTYCNRNWNHEAKLFN